MADSLESLDTAQSLADYLRCSPAKIRKDSRHPDFPRIMIGRRAVRYDRLSVLDYYRAKQRTKGTSAEEAKANVEAANG